jgi:glycerophosphoryl diester phosphodiesterase
VIVIAHRAYRSGIDRGRENKVEAIAESFSRGWGVETDIRRSPQGAFYLSHDESICTQENDARELCGQIRKLAPPIVALNIKELGYERELISFLEAQAVTDRVFLFDMELLEGKPGCTASIYRALHPTIKLASRCSDRSEPLERALMCPQTSVVWADEFDSLWLTKDDVESLKQAGKSVFAISPEIHGFSIDDRNRRWSEFRQWGVDGVCTDYPEDLNGLLRRPS